jgi:hypothetical protein
MKIKICSDRFVIEPETRDEQAQLMTIATGTRSVEVSMSEHCQATHLPASDRIHTTASST